MNEAEWNASENPDAMLRYLMDGCRLKEGGTPCDPRVTARRLRLFACACCRAVRDGAKCRACDGDGVDWDNAINYSMANPACHECHGSGRVGGLTDPRSRRAVEVAERFADGLATEAELDDAYRAAGNAEDSNIAYDARECCQPLAMDSAISITHTPHIIPSTTQAALLRDVFGNPFQTTLRHDSLVVDDLLSWNDGAVRKLASAIYNSRAWGDVPLLADALEDAGCDDAAILGHLRGPGPHVRGCWVLDLLLGKS